MRKSIVIVGITFILVAVLLSGCNDQNVDTESNSKFIGTWDVEYPQMPSEYEETWTFYENKTVKSVIIREGESITEFLNWDDNDNKLCIFSPAAPNAQKCYSYEFTNSNTSITFTFNDQLVLTLNKV